MSYFLQGNLKENVFAVIALRPRWFFLGPAQAASGLSVAVFTIGAIGKEHMAAPRLLKVA